MDPELLNRSIAFGVGLGISGVSFAVFIVVQNYLQRRAEREFLSQLQREWAEKDKKFYEWLEMTNPDGLVDFEKGLDYKVITASTALPSPEL